MKMILFSVPTASPSSNTPLTVYLGETVTEQLMCNEADVDGTVVSCVCELTK